MATVIKTRPVAKKAVAKKVVATPRARARTTRATTQEKDTGKVIMVKVASLPGITKDVALRSGAATVEQALRGFGIHADQAKDVRVNNTPVKANDKTQLREGSFVTIVGQVNGGN